MEKDMKSEKILGQIIQIGEGDVLVNCLLTETPRKVFSVRRFPIEPFIGTRLLKLNKIIEIETHIAPGMVTILYNEGDQTLLEEGKFDAEDYFSKYKGTPFSGGK